MNIEEFIVKADEIYSSLWDSRFMGRKFEILAKKLNIRMLIDIDDVLL